MCSIACPPKAVELAAQLRERLDELPVRQVADPLPAELRAGMRDLEVAIVEPGIHRRDAEHAVARWLIEQLPIEKCVELEQMNEARSMRRPLRQDE